MCEILESVKAKQGIFVICTPYNGDFMKAKTVKLYDKDNNCFATEDFRMDKTRQCFNNKPIAPWVILKCDAAENFLQRGNQVAFEY